MPVNGKIVKLNEALLTGDRNILVQYPENSGWVAMIIPSQPYDRTGLVLPGEYQANRKKSYQK